MIIQVTILRGGENDVVAFRNRLDPSFRTPPGHHGRVRCQAAFQNLIPADDPFSVFHGKAFHPLDHITLQFFHRIESFRLHPRPAIRAAGPIVLSGLVAADMDIRAGKQVENLQQHLFQELVRALLPGTQFPLVIQ